MSINLSKTETLLAEANAIKAEIARLERELKVRTDSLASSVNFATGKVQTAVGSFTVRENNSYDEKVMREALKPGQVRLCEKKVLDKAKVKALYPQVYAKAQRKNGVSVTIG